MIEIAISVNGNHLLFCYNSTLHGHAHACDNHGKNIVHLLKELGATS